jgi:acetoin utilization protein AcuB
MSPASVGDFMTRAPHTIEQEQPLSDGYALMRTYQVRHLPVVHGGKLVGILSQRDLHFMATLRDVDPTRIAVSEAMSMDTYAVEPDEALADVTREMAEHRYGSAVVLEQGRVVGIFTTVDALRVLTDVLERRPRSASAVAN